jgi:signal transduction histidine kinase
MKKWMSFAVAACTLAFAGAALAQDKATLDEAKAMAEAAAAHVKKVGAEQAFKDFNDKATTVWKKKDLYVFAYNMKGDCVAHGANDQLIGKNQIELKDPNGKPVVRELIAAATKGTGRVDYDWPNPVSKKVEAKASYVVKLAEYDGFVGVGAYR